MKSYSESYKAAGVDVTAGYRAVDLIKKNAAETLTANVLTGIGGFGAMYELDTEGIKKPVLVSGTDGVGTKLKLAFLMDKHNTIGIDCVAMCVNDIIACTAKPLFFLDYIATGKLYPEKIAEIVSGITEGCILAGCSLVGGETAEMPGFYATDEYDLAGFCVGIADKDKIIRHENQKAGDVLIALKSSGVHSNGFSLIRKVFSMNEQVLRRHYADIEGELGDCLLTPTRIYVRPVLKLLESVPIKAITHITGGAFYENIPRQLPVGITARIERAAIQVLPIFNLIAGAGHISERDMFNTFNMGVGMVITVDKNDADKALSLLRESGETAYIMGELVDGDEGVLFV